MREKPLKISELARRAGVTPKAVRFYEARGVVPPALRSPNGYRLYTPDAVDMLRFVKQAQRTGLTLAEITEVVAIRQGGRPPCRHVHQLLQQKAAELDQRVTDLLTLRRRIRQSLAAWGRRPVGTSAVCPHLEAPLVRGRGRRARAGSPSPRTR